MQGIEFETDQSFSPGASTTPGTKKTIFGRLLMNVGITDQATANYVLLGIAAIFFGVSIFIYAGILREPEKDWSLDTRAAIEMQQAQYLK